MGKKKRPSKLAQKRKAEPASKTQTKSSPRSRTRPQHSAPSLLDPIDEPSEPSAELAARLFVDEMIHSLEKTDAEEGFLSILLKAIRKSFQCKYYLLASRHNSSEKIETLYVNAIDFPRDNLKSRLPEIFKNTLESKERIWGTDITSSAEPPFIATARSVSLCTIDQEAIQLDLLLLLSDRKISHDSEFSKAIFNSSEQFLLRMFLLIVAMHIKERRHEKISSLEKVMLGQYQAPLLLLATKDLLDYDSQIGLSIDDKVLKNWLEAERNHFLGGGSTADFEDALKQAKDWLDSDKVSENTGSLRNILFECHLAHLTKKGGFPLLSQRIEKAQSLAGLS